MIILSIDPGPETSGSCLYDTEARRVLWSSSDIDNYELRQYVYDQAYYDPDESVKNSPPARYYDAVAIETIEPMGLGVGKSTLDTAIWVGRYYESVKSSPRELSVELISRGDEKIILCGCKTFIDPVTGKRKGVTNAQIRQAVIDRFEPSGGGKRPQIGTKKQPGPLYGVSSHAWSAVAIALTYEEQFINGKTV